MASERPNVVFVLTDDQGYGDLSCHGNPVVKTPHIDALCDESVRLKDYHVGPTCAPTRAGLLTGHYANSTGVWHTIGGRSLLRADEISMADYFRDSGYVTGIFGKWHLGDNAPYRPQDRGFDTVVVHGGGGVGQTPDYWGNNYFDDSYWDGEGHARYEGYCTDIWFQEALKFIERNRQKPFFCYIPTNAPHSPFLVDPVYSDPYVAVTPHQQRANFYGMLANIDENVGGLRRRLAEMGLAENTIFIFMTDNGSGGGLKVDDDQFVTSGFNAGMRGQKGSEYDGGHRVPFFLHWPAGGIDEGRDVEAVTANVDILPTLIELCGLESAEGNSFDGRNLAQLMRPEVGKRVDWHDRALVTDSQRLTYPVKWRKSAVMTDSWRLVNGRELYSIKNDPEQRSNVADSNPDVVSELRLAYEEWWRKVSRQFAEDIPIAIGGSEATRLRLNTHDWRNEDCECAWNQSLVRQGLICNGHWEVEVVEAGTYRFELRRWPVEEDAPITAGLAGGEPTPFSMISIRAAEEVSVEQTGADSEPSLKERVVWGGGAALQIRKARILIGDEEAGKEIDAEDEAARFTLTLPAGGTHLQTWFEMEDGKDLGAYYVYVEQLTPTEIQHQ